MPTAPDFIDRDPEAILAEVISLYETELGRTVYPAQAERLVINGIVAVELIILEKLQRAMEQMLLSFASAPALDYLAELVGVTRLPAQGAGCTLEFTLVTGHGGVVIPAGTRVATVDGRVVFQTQDNYTVASGTDVVEVEAFAATLGTVGNGYAAGEVNTILDPQAFIQSVENLAETAGGADAETDDELRDRTRLAPASFSVAGPKNAYKYFARTASSAIIDVAVQQITPGTVGVYPLVAGGTTPSEILTLVENTLNDDSVRPLCDTVVVESPDVVAYDIDVEITTYEDADTELIQSAIEAALQTLTDSRAATLGRDVNVSQVIAACMVDGVFDVTVVAPVADVVVAFNEVAIVGTIDVTITGESEG